MVALDWIDEMAMLGDEDEIYAGPDHVTAFDVKDRHALLIVGFGPDYWLVQNSHGTDWGNGGYAKFTSAQVHGRFLINDAWAAAGITYEDLNRNAYPVI
ncbi:cathepsin 7-like [Trifolium medium]|uniref:Cathepsin 7-like n=1 Tax=Trifolium medium TaxID=97028 RepID=A0A392MZ60_9FABA|nr:cathepsin 7-like [Trifolium medium]